MSRYQAYVYGYPHKTAYRPLEPALPLAPLWAGEQRDRLFLYLHIPFCEQRCGFCNLFTQPVPHADRVASYLATLARQVAVVRDVLDDGGPFAIARAAIGGGTPTLLDPDQLTAVYRLLGQLGFRAGVPMSVETSPETALPERLAIVVGSGADRISIGVQSFIESECRAVNRPQQPAEVHRALRAIRDAGPRTLNIDLMYGLPGQTAATWRHTLDSALEYRPEEIYLYPLYVRPLTTLGRKQLPVTGDPRAALYDQARDELVARGYRQISMRMFQRQAIDTDHKLAYCCQSDGMIGLGVGARSYTQRVHYSSEWAVGARGVREIIDRWITRSDREFAIADYGFVLDDAEQRRRWMLLSVLSDDGLDCDAYRARFAAAAVDDFPELAELTDRGWLATDGAILRLTPEGQAHADAIGPSLFSPVVRQRMAEYDLR